MLSKRPVYLIGFMGAGKTTLGFQLANRLNLSYTDTDHLIEDFAKLSIARLFELYGEAYFRLLEAQICRGAFSGIVSTGGGAPIYYDTLTWLKKQGMVIFIDTPFDTIYSRLILEGSERPIAHLKSKSELEQLYDDRRQIYLNAEVCFVPERSLEKDLNNLITLIDP